MYNPLEMAFCGFSNSGKTTVITRLIRELSGQYAIGYVKHDVHGFDMDREGKDTFRAKQSGARAVYISDREHSAFVRSPAPDIFVQQYLLSDNDFVFVEGHKRTDIPKIIFVDDSEKIFDVSCGWPFKNVIAFCGSKQTCKRLPKSKPYFHRDDAKGLKEFILRKLYRQAVKVPLYGLVLAGGKSRRMKRDKSLIKYHGLPQVEHAYRILSAQCNRAFVSLRAQQAQLKGYSRLPQIPDTFCDIGPLGGILSAMTAFPDAAWLVFACDLPFADKDTVKNLLAKRDPFRMASAYKSAYDEMPEPLCAVYEPKSRHRLLSFLSNGILCPRKILTLSRIHLIPPSEPHALDNINTTRERQAAKDRILMKIKSG